MNIESQIEKLTDLGSAAVQNTIIEYTKYELTSAISWLFFGFALLFIGIKIWKWSNIKNKDDDVDRFLTKVLAGVIIFISLLTIPANIPTIINPKAAAIKALIRNE